MSLLDQDLNYSACYGVDLGLRQIARESALEANAHAAAGPDELVRERDVAVPDDVVRVVQQDVAREALLSRSGMPPPAAG